MEWMCAECSKPHAKNSPPCNNCGAMQFEKTVVRKRPDDDDANPSNLRWECPECGRTHPKNSPPCSRCGNMQLEGVEVGESLDSGETEAGIGLLDVAKFVGAIAVVAVLLLGAVNAGILSQNQSPTVENVPGDANYSSGLDLQTVGFEIYEDINEKRVAEGREPISLEPATTEIAEYHNRLMVKRGEYPLQSPNDVSGQFDSCSDWTLAFNRIQYENDQKRAIDAYRDEGELAEALSSSWFGETETRPTFLDERVSNVGVDVHVAEGGAVYATVAFC